MKKKILLELTRLQELARQCKVAITVKLSDKYVWLTYDETLVHQEHYKQLQSKRILGLDLNPNYIGLSVLEFNKTNEFVVLHKRVYDLTRLNIKSGKPSTDKASKHLTHKRHYENIAIAREVSGLVNVWKCKTVAVEDLDIKPSDTGKGKNVNRKCNNVWQRRLFITKLKMLAGIHGFDVTEVNPAYSSIVGNFAYGNGNTPDMVAASIEIARRAYRKFEKGWFYPRFNIQFRDEQWKQTLGSVDDWKGLFRKIKETGLKYRYLLGDYVRNAVFSKNYIQRCYNIYIFA